MPGAFESARGPRRRMCCWGMSLSPGRWRPGGRRGPGRCAARTLWHGGSPLHHCAGRSTQQWRSAPSGSPVLCVGSGPGLPGLPLRWDRARPWCLQVPKAEPVVGSADAGRSGDRSSAGHRGRPDPSPRRRPHRASAAAPQTPHGGSRAGDGRDQSPARPDR